MMFTFTEWLDELIKGHGHKYIKRIPYMTPKGRRYRYIYSVTHSHQGKHVMDESHLIEGTKFMVHTESGKEVHAHIKSVSGNKVTYVLDDGPDKGKEVTKTRSEIVSLLNDTHGVDDKVNAKREQLKAQIEQARKTGTEKQVKRLESQLRRLGGEPAKQEEPAKPSNPYAEVLEKMRVSPEDLDIKKWYKRGAPRGFKNGQVTGNSGNAPDASMYRRLLAMQDRREAVCEQYNKGLERSFNEIQKRMGSLSQELEDINREIETLQATPTQMEADQTAYNSFLNLLRQVKLDPRDNNGASIDVGSIFNLSFRAVEYWDAEAYRNIIQIFRQNGVPAPPEDLDTRVTLYALKNRALLRGKAEITETAKRWRRTELKEKQREVFEKIEEKFKDVIFADTPEDYDEIMTHSDVVPTDYYPIKRVRGEDHWQQETATPRHSHLVSQFEDRFKALYPEYAKKSVQLMYTNIQRECSFGDAHGSTIEINKNTTDRTMIHECAHSLEYHIPHLVDMVTLGISKRVKPNKRVKITKSESAFEDEFVSNYTTKLYNAPKQRYKNNEGYNASEVITMGMQEFLPMKMSRLLLADPHHFALTFAVMKGYFK